MALNVRGAPEPPRRARGVNLGQVKPSEDGAPDRGLAKEPLPQGLELEAALTVALGVKLAPGGRAAPQ